MRVGQVWHVGDRLLEILAFRDDQIEYMEWEFLEERGPWFGSILYVSAKYDYFQYPTKTGGRYLWRGRTLRNGLPILWS